MKMPNINELKFSPTRFTTNEEGLVYGNMGNGVWSFFVADFKANGFRGIDKAPSRVGPVYSSKTELLADLPRYAASYGYEV
jgi:hypothetical protein